MIDTALESWKKKRVLVTGHNGFKGTWLCAILLRLGARVAGYALPADPDTQVLYTTSHLDSRIESHHGDILDLARLQSIFQEFRPHFVFHLAAQSLVRPGYNDPTGTLQTNILGTVNLLECCRKSSSLGGVLVVTSDKCYANRSEPLPYCESDSLGGRDPYSASKACAEIVTACYRESFLTRAGVAVATARAGNVIGGGDLGLDRLVPDAYRAFRDGRSLKVRNPHSKRPWQHVLDPLFGYLKLGHDLLSSIPEATGAFNFGPDKADTVERLLKRMKARWGPKFSYATESTPSQFLETEQLQISSDKAKSVLGWKPQWEISVAVERTADFYQRWLGGTSTESLLNRDIEAYFTT